MTALVYFVTLLVVSRAAAEIVELNCSDNATCIENLTKDFARSLRQKKTVRLFDFVTVEPLQRTRQARSNQGLLARFLSNHAFSFDWKNIEVRLSRPEERNDAVELEVFEGRSARDLSEQVPKKTGSAKVANAKEEEEEEKRPKRLKGNRRQRKKVLQALIPMMFGMKSAGTVIFAMAMVTALTMKAFVASKLALMVTVGMALKRLYESYYNGVGLQNHPYLYSQYPIDFPSASSHAYSVSGVSPNFASPELFNPSALTAHTHAHEMLQQGDASAQQSQQAPTLQLVNNTRASERWDGKSTLQKFLEPILNGIRSIVDPIASVFYDAMPATFRGMTSDVTTAKYHNDEPLESASTIVEEKVKKPREILVPQPRNIAQRKTTNVRKRGLRHKPKKYSELKIDLDKLKRNKDFNDYIKTKKYRYNYPYTSYYPRVKHFTIPSTFVVKPNNNRLVSYKRDSLLSNSTDSIISLNSTEGINDPFFNFNTDNSSDWKPIVDIDNLPINGSTGNLTHSRLKRHAVLNFPQPKFNRNSSHIFPLGYKSNVVAATARGHSHSWLDGLFSFFDFLVTASPAKDIIKGAQKLTKKLMKSSIKIKETSGPPKYYLLTYDFVMFSLAVVDDFVNMKTSILDHLYGDHKSTHKPHHHHHHHHHFQKPLQSYKPHESHKPNKIIKKKKKTKKPLKEPESHLKTPEKSELTLESRDKIQISSKSPVKSRPILKAPETPESFLNSPEKTKPSFETPENTEPSNKDYEKIDPPTETPDMSDSFLKTPENPELPLHTDELVEKDESNENVESTEKYESTERNDSAQKGDPTDESYIAEKDESAENDNSPQKKEPAIIDSLAEA